MAALCYSAAITTTPQGASLAGFFLCPAFRCAATRCQFSTSNTGLDAMATSYAQQRLPRCAVAIPVSTSSDAQSLFAQTVAMRRVQGLASGDENESATVIACYNLLVFVETSSTSSYAQSALPRLADKLLWLYHVVI